MKLHFRNLPAGESTQTNAYMPPTRRIGDALGLVLVGVVILSPTINVTDHGALRYATMAGAGAIAVAVLNKARLSSLGEWLLAVLGVCLVLSLLGTAATIDVISPQKVVGATLVVFATPLLYRRNPRLFLGLLGALLAANLLMAAIQLLGITNSVFRHVTYANDALPTSVFDSSFTTDPATRVAFLPQARPSGLFPAPTYLSHFLVLCWLMVVTNPASRSRGALFAFGALAAVSGSTLGVVVVAASIPWIRTKPSALLVLVGFGLTAAAYSQILPANFEANNSLDDLSGSIFARIGEHDDGTAESILQTRPAMLAAVIGALGIGVTLAARFNLMSIARAGVAILLPLMVHDTEGSSYLMATALAAQECLGLALINPKVPHAVTGTVLP